MSTITIENVNEELLNKQRLVLVKVLLDDNNGMSKEYENELDGLLNMLDYWYDTQYNPEFK